MTSAFIDKLGFLDIKDRKVLHGKNFGKDKWFTPGGKREGNETDVEALIREVKEELGVDLIPGSIKPYGVFQAQAHGKPEGTMVRIICYIADYRGVPTPSTEVEELAYFDYSRYNDATATGQLILDDLKKKNLID